MVSHSFDSIGKSLVCPRVGLPISHTRLTRSTDSATRPSGLLVDWLRLHRTIRGATGPGARQVYAGSWQVGKLDTYRTLPCRPSHHDDQQNSADGNAHRNGPVSVCLFVCLLESYVLVTFKIHYQGWLLTCDSAVHWLLEVYILEISNVISRIGFDL